VRPRARAGSESPDSTTTPTAPSPAPAPAPAPADGGENEEVGWRWTQVALNALSMLRTAMLELAASPPPTPTSPAAQAKQSTPPSKQLPPRAPADLLGMRDLQTINSVVEFLLVLGLVPALAPGIGLPLPARLGPNGRTLIAVGGRREARLAPLPSLSISFSFSLYHTHMRTLYCRGLWQGPSVAL
jgi:hypothetical protein